MLECLVSSLDTFAKDCTASHLGRSHAQGSLMAAFFSGMVLAYLMSGSPCVLACLWPVTDKDIDKYLAKCLSEWMVEGTVCLGNKCIVCFLVQRECQQNKQMPG